MISILQKQRTKSRSVLPSGAAADRSQKWSITPVPDWWTAVPKGERALLQAIARILRSAKRSHLPEVARAAAKWERGIGCFVKVRLIREKQRAESTARRSRNWKRQNYDRTES
jgi:hypothetical protein